MMRWLRRRPNKKRISNQWKELQKFCATRKTWPLAVLAADKLLDDALKARRYKGKTMGERLVAAQHALTDNEAVWFGHKLCSHLPSDDVRKLKKQDIVEALAGYRQALRDLGALDNDFSRD